METFSVDGFDAHEANARVGVWVFNNVTNAAEVKRALMDGKLDVTLLNSTSVAAMSCIELACYKARVAASRDGLVTKALHAEVVFCLSPSRHISESFRRFGGDDSSTSLIVCKFDPQDGDDAALRQLIAGDVVKFADKAPHDAATLRKWYKINESELALGSLEDAILSRIAIRDVA